MVHSRSRSDVSGLARSSTVNLIGGVATAVLTVALTLVLTRGLAGGAAGLVFSVVALFQVLMAVGGLGVETGLVRYISARPDGSLAGGALLRVALIPVAVVGLLVAVGLFAVAPGIGSSIGGDAFSGEAADALRAVAPFLPAAALTGGLLGATRGYATMLPTVALDRVGRPLLQVAVVALTVWRGATPAFIAGAWAGVFLIEMVGAWWWLRRLDSGEVIVDSAGVSPRQGAASFWRFTLPRAVATSSRVALQWLDVVLVSALASPEDAAVYAVATRIVQFGMLAAFSVGQAVEPLFGLAIGSGDDQRTRHLYKVATGWLMLLTWPFYQFIAAFAPTILELFGTGFGRASGTVLILVVSVLIGAAAGPADFLLVMRGKSSLSLWNTLAALGSNVILNLWLIPRWGLVGAGLSWSASRVLANVLPLMQLRRHSLQPFGKGWTIAALASTMTFGLVGFSARVVFGDGLGVAAAAGLVSFVCFAIIVYRFRRPLAVNLAAR